MFNDLIDTAARRMCDACEKSRRLEGAVSRAASLWDGVELSEEALNRLLDSFGRTETDAAGDVESAEKALAKAGNLLVSGVVGSDVARAARAVSTIAANVDRIAGLSVKIVDGIASLTSGDLESTIGAVGGKLGAAVDSGKQTFDRFRKAFTAATVPPTMLPENIELTAFSSSDLESGFASGLSDASFSNSHLLVLTTSLGESFYFNLSTAGYDILRRQTSYNIAAQDRLTRRPALQAVSKGGESITVSGAIFTRKSGAGQLNRLRSIGFAMAPLMLTTGYGEALGQWYLTRIEEEQGALFADGMPRKQQFSLEFQRYGEDYSDL